MADNIGGPIYGPNDGGRQYVLQKGIAALAAGTVTITVPRKVSTAPLTLGNEIMVWAAKNGTVIATGAAGNPTFPGAVVRCQNVAIASGAVSFDIKSDDAADTDTVVWSALIPA